ncbi:MAG: hypothetical protein DRJ55_05145 [Thermoprotei archaeon]|nr:hypothetical protein [Thermoproteales archaeon]RLE91277.1 MAG: hypothetical protein DRJ46_02610 [Thermoprotei archaeon]RLE91858.1 MAG: hypothetical protein DRJ55_05145 [Thermoprotei archaeon]
MLPPTVIIILELKRRKGSARDKDLYEAVKQILSSMSGDISFSQFNKMLMTLELRGLIRVEPLKKNVRTVYLT